MPPGSASGPGDIRVLGVYPLPEAPDPCFLVELEIAAGVQLDPATITQEAEGTRAWQRPFEAHRLSDDGIRGALSVGLERGPARLAFLFHFLRLDRPLLTPAGPVPLPPPGPRPDRLGFLADVLP